MSFERSETSLEMMRFFAYAQNDKKEKTTALYLLIVNKKMKKYISPEMIVVRIDTQEVIANSPDTTTLGWKSPNAEGGSTNNVGDFAAPTYRNTLWNE